MRSYALVAILAGVAAANTIAMSLGGNHLSLLPARDNIPVFGQTLNTRAPNCEGSDTACGPGCMDLGATCCSEQTGGYCRKGYYCRQDAMGCCADGTTCSGKPTGCLPGKVECGERCMDMDSVCCNDGSICAAGVTCGSSSCVGGGSITGGGSNGADKPTGGIAASSSNYPGTTGSGNANAPGFLVALVAVLPLVL